MTNRLIPLTLVLITAAAAAYAADWPEWGRDGSRNMTSPEKGLVDSFEPGKQKDDSENIDPATTKNVRWVAKLGSYAYGNPTVAKGKVFVGTNNEPPRDEKHEGDRGILACFSEADGKFLWQLVVPKLAAGSVSDFESTGLCSPATVEGARVYVITNRCEILCLDIDALTNGNDGPFKDEAQYFAGPGNPPVEPGPTDADILWRFDMRDELGVFPHNMTTGSVLIVGDRLFAATGNGVDWTHHHIPAPLAPALICLDKNTGKLIAQENSGISGRTFHANWSSPTLGNANGKPIVIFGAGDGWCYAFDPEPVKGSGDVPTLKEIWRYDCNPPEYRKNKYSSSKGPSEIVGTPVFHDNRVYVAIGQDPDHGSGVGMLHCIDATKTGDVTQSGKIWSYDKIDRTLSTAAIADGLLFIGDMSGIVHCLDAKTGAVHWTHDTRDAIWGAATTADGRVYVGNATGVFTILAAAKEKREIATIEFDAGISSSPVVANGTVFVATDKHLYAIGGPRK